MKLPNGWKEEKLGDIVEISSGGTPSKENTLYWGNEYPWISAKDMKIPIVTDSIDKLSKEGYKVANIAKQGSLLILIRGMTLHHDVPVCVAGCDVAFNQDVKCLSINNDVDVIYLLMYLKAKKSKLLELVDSAGNGTGRLDTDLLKNMTITFPQMSEQKEIAKTLSVWDNMIEKMEQLITAEEEQLSALAIKFWKDFITSEWKERKLNELLIEHGQKSTRKEDVYSVSVHNGLINQIEYLGRSFAASNTDNYNLVHYGDIVYTKSPTGDFPYGIVKQSKVKKNVIVSPLYGVYTPKNFEIGRIIEFYFQSPIRAKNYLYPLIQKGSKNTINITNQDFLLGTIPIPEDNTEQKKIVEIIDIAQKKIDLLKVIESKYKLQKQG